MGHTATVCLTLQQITDWFSSDYNNFFILPVICELQMFLCPFTLNLCVFLFKMNVMWATYSCVFLF